MATAGQGGNPGSDRDDRHGNRGLAGRGPSLGPCSRHGHGHSPGHGNGPNGYSLHARMNGVPMAMATTAMTAMAMMEGSSRHPEESHARFCQRCLGNARPVWASQRGGGQALRDASPEASPKASPEPCCARRAWRRRVHSKQGLPRSRVAFL